MGQRSKGILCKRCHENGGEMDGGKILCRAAGNNPVIPVLREPGLRFEDCKNRVQTIDLGRPARSPEVLKKISKRVVRLKKRYPNLNHSLIVAVIEERIVARSAK